MRVLIIGLGSIAVKHIEALRSIDSNTEIFGLRSSKSSAKIEGVTDIFEFSDIPYLGLDFTIISNPTALHADTIRALIPYDIPLFIEKPLFDNIENEIIINEIEHRGTLNYVACNLRFLDCLIFAKDLIKDKVINEVNSYCGSYLPDWRPSMDFRKSYSANKDMGGGVHIDLIHEMDYVYWFFGMPVNVRSIKTSNSSLNISAYDYASYTLEYPFFTANIVLNYYRRDSKRSFEIVTSEGTVYVNLLKNSVSFNDTVIFTSHKTVLDTYEDQLIYFINTVLKSKEQINSINEAYQILQLCLQGD